MDDVVQAVETVSRAGWPAVAFAVVVFVSFLSWRAYKKEQRDLDEFKRLLDVYDEDVRVGDLAHAASVAVRLRQLRKRLGIPESLP